MYSFVYRQLINFLFFSVIFVNKKPELERVHYPITDINQHPRESYVIDFSVMTFYIKIRDSLL